MKTTFLEPSRETAIAGEYDVIVCGGGPAGVSAAIRAAREGARTRLIEGHGCLGGIWTAGLLSYVIDADKPGTFVSELRETLIARNAGHRRVRENFIYDPEAMKLELERLALEAGVEVRLHTRVVAAGVEDGRLHTVLTESKSGREAWQARVFIDCTGDGDLAALAGNRFELGRGPRQEVQPMSLMALVTGPEPEVVRPFFDHTCLDRKAAFLAEIRAGGVDPSYSAPTLFHIRENLYALMANHEYHVRPDDAQALSDATIRARAEVGNIAQALQRTGGPWETLRVVATAEQIGIREGRRIAGRARVHEDDLVAGRRRADAVCRATASMDVHSPDPGFSRDYDFRTRRNVLPYDIPYGALVAADIEGLLVAGRCISGDFLSHSSYRVTGNAAVMGEAAGLAAAFCAQHGLAPHALAWPPNLQPAAL